MVWLSWVILGTVVGVIARFVMPGNQSMGPLGTVSMGSIGALLGGYLGRNILHFGAHEALTPEALMAAGIGSLVVLTVCALISR